MIPGYIPVPYDEKDFFFFFLVLVLEGLVGLHRSGGIDLDNCDIEWFILKMNRDHSVVFKIAPKYCISDSFVDCEGYSISYKGFLPTAVDVMVI